MSPRAGYAVYLPNGAHLLTMAALLDQPAGRRYVQFPGGVPDPLDRWLLTEIHGYMAVQEHLDQRRLQALSEEELDAAYRIQLRLDEFKTIRWALVTRRLDPTSVLRGYLPVRRVPAHVSGDDVVVAADDDAYGTRPTLADALKVRRWHRGLEDGHDLDVEDGISANTYYRWARTLRP
ncbi:MAG: hypothetical protein AAFV53_30170 [Myxococcota bacterium]